MLNQVQHDILDILPFAQQAQLFNRMLVTCINSETITFGELTQ